jgi:hypothetical protein
VKLLVFLIFVLLTAVSISSLSGEPKKALKDFKWSPLTELDTDSEKSYYDRNNTIPLLSNNSKTYNLGLILTASKNPFPVETETGPMMARSLVTYVIIECNSGNLVMGYRMFYDVAMPPSIGSPLSIKKYLTLEDSTIRVDKSSALYDSLCPKTI